MIQALAVLPRAQFPQKLDIMAPRSILRSSAPPFKASSYVQLRDSGRRGGGAGREPARAPEGAWRGDLLKAAGKLDSADQAAAKVLAYLSRPDFGDAPVADVREA